MVSVKILKELGWEPYRILDQLNQWPKDAVALAIKKVFS
jgi:hypothetical protein